MGTGFGVLASSFAPGLSLLPALAIGMAAGVAVTGLPVTSIALLVPLLGEAATSQMPLVIVAVVTAMVMEEPLSSSPSLDRLTRRDLRAEPIGAAS